MAETNPVFDIAIIGGGIAGAAIARDASLRRARVILFEKSTFGSGTSSKRFTEASVIWSSPGRP
jgi:glycerol-3-phosphate dehydrogenase